MLSMMLFRKKKLRKKRQLLPKGAQHATKKYAKHCNTAWGIKSGMFFLVLGEEAIDQPHRPWNLKNKIGYGTRKKC